MLNSFTKTGSNSLCFPGSRQDSQACATTHDAELVTLLHRFGHGLSYSQIEELEIAIAEQQITRDEEDVQKVMGVISQWRNPFKTADDLVSLSSGSIASNALKEDLLKAEQKGKSALVSFDQQCSRVPRDTTKAEVRDIGRGQEDG